MDWMKLTNEVKYLLFIWSSTQYVRRFISLTNKPWNLLNKQGEANEMFEVEKDKGDWVEKTWKRHLKASIEVDSKKTLVVLTKYVSYEGIKNMEENLKLSTNKPMRSHLIQHNNPWRVLMDNSKLKTNMLSHEGNQCKGNKEEVEENTNTTSK